MSRVGRDVLGVVALGALSLLGGEGLAHASSPHSHWIGTWEMSPAGLPTISKIGADSLPPIITVKGTIRYRIRISLGGSQVRLRFSNEYGKSALTVAAVSVAVAAHGLDAVSGSLQPVTFGGSRSSPFPRARQRFPTRSRSGCVPLPTCS